MSHTGLSILEYLCIAYLVGLFIHGLIGFSLTMNEALEDLKRQETYMPAPRIDTALCASLLAITAVASVTWPVWWVILGLWWLETLRAEWMDPKS